MLLPFHFADVAGSRKSMGVFRSPARKAPQEATKAAPSSQPSKTVTIRPAKLPLGPHATKPLCGAHEKLQQMMCDFADFFNWKLPWAGPCLNFFWAIGMPRSCQTMYELQNCSHHAMMPWLPRSPKQKPESGSEALDWHQCLIYIYIHVWKRPSSATSRHKRWNFARHDLIDLIGRFQMSICCEWPLLEL